MIDLGSKESKLYPATQMDEAEATYPKLYLPMDVLEGMKVKLGDRLMVECEAEVCSLSEDENRSEICFKLKKAGVETLAEEAAENQASEKKGY